MLPALERLKAQGKIMETGVFRKTELETSFPTNYHQCHPFTLEVFSCRESKVSLGKGFFQRHHRNAIFGYTAADVPNDELQKMADKYQLSQQQFLLAWLLQHPGTYHPVLRGEGQEKIDAAVKAFHTKLIREDREKFPKQL